MSVHNTWGLKKIRNRMFKDLECVIKARNAVMETDMSIFANVEMAIMVCKKIEEYSKHYAQTIGVMKEQLEIVESNGVEVDSNRFLFNYRALKEDTAEVVAVMFEMYTDVYNKIYEVMGEDCYE